MRGHAPCRGDRKKRPRPPSAYVFAFRGDPPGRVASLRKLSEASCRDAHAGPCAALRRANVGRSSTHHTWGVSCTHHGIHRRSSWPAPCPSRRSSASANCHEEFSDSAARETQRSGAPACASHAQQGYITVWILLIFVAPRLAPPLQPLQGPTVIPRPNPPPYVAPPPPSAPFPVFEDARPQSWTTARPGPINRAPNRPPPVAQHTAVPGEEFDELAFCSTQYLVASTRFTRPLNRPNVS